MILIWSSDRFNSALSSNNCVLIQFSTNNCARAVLSSRVTCPEKCGPFRQNRGTCRSHEPPPGVPQRERRKIVSGKESRAGGTCELGKGNHIPAGGKNRAKAHGHIFILYPLSGTILACFNKGRYFMKNPAGRSLFLKNAPPKKFGTVIASC